jgi:hypothetical protein
MGGKGIGSFAQSKIVQNSQENPVTLESTTQNNFSQAAGLSSLGTKNMFQLSKQRVELKMNHLKYSSQVFGQSPLSQSSGSLLAGSTARAGAEA